MSTGKKPDVTRLSKNMKLLGKTIADVVHEMSPTMSCTCKAGIATIPLTLAEESVRAWKKVAK